MVGSTEKNAGESLTGDVSHTKKVIVVGPDGQPIDQLNTPTDDDRDGVGERTKSITEMVEQPAKVMRIGTMIKQLLEEVRQAPLDEASRARLKAIYQRSIVELEQGLAPELQDELNRLSLPFTDDEVPSESELRIAQAQLVGWLEGLFHGIQTALFAQQMTSRAALEQMRGTPAALSGGLPSGQQNPGEDRPTGQYL
ncbi:MAG: bacterial proteasome activator family protein [Antricoccus sp.]